MLLVVVLVVMLLLLHHRRRRPSPQLHLLPLLHHCHLVLAWRLRGHDERAAAWLGMWQSGSRSPLWHVRTLALDTLRRRVGRCRLSHARRPYDDEYWCRQHPAPFASATGCCSLTEPFVSTVCCTTEFDTHDAITATVDEVRPTAVRDHVCVLVRWLNVRRNGEKI